ncbi:MAG TPA: hypothetical protein VEO20_09290 [Thermoplasmata archaeon]|nr:hypothetical protein [Thermoplasmata archaeon]
MGRTSSLFTYKLRFFFGPSLRGRFGPLLYLILIMIFIPSGYVFGTGLGISMRKMDPTQAVNLLATPLAALLSIGLLYSLGAGVTAHASEFDFFFTSNVRPREYLVADLLFQFFSLFAAGGLAAGVAALGIVVALGRPLVTAVPLFGVLIVYAFFVLMTSQVLVVLRVKYPKAPVRVATVFLLILSILPAVAVGQPGFVVRYDTLPIPSTAFAALGLAILRATPVSLVDIGTALAYAVGIALAWAVLSTTYIFHGIRPTLSAGFGQVDLGSRMEMQRRMTAGLGRFTTRVRLRTERGGDTGLMTRLHLVRIWRDGSILFVLLFALIAILPAGLTPGEATSTAAITVTQTLTFLLAILAMNWAFYERDNLWIVVTSSKGTGAYFRGLMLGFLAIGLATTAAFLGILAATRALTFPIESLALPVASPVAAAFVATAFLTRVKLKPSAFSLAALGIFFVVSLGGFIGGLAAQTAVFAAGAILGFAEIAQAAVLGAFVVGLVGFGLWAVTRLATSFRL